MNAIEAGVYTVLAGANALTEALGGSYIYNSVAPQGQAMPYVIFSHQGGGHEAINPSGLQNHVYLVKAVDDEPKSAGTIQDHIVTALNGVALTVSDYTAFYCRAEVEVQYTEVAQDGTVIYHRGHIYRIRIDD